MATATQEPDLLTPEQAAEHLQVTRGTVYRYIREGKLMASRLGRTYRIERASLKLLLMATRARPDIALRDYSAAEIEEFLHVDQLDDDTRRIAERILGGSASSTS